MKATLILDSEGPNPDYLAPSPRDFATDEEYHDALALYDVPPTVIVPAGTLLAGGFVVVHCHPDDSGLRVVADPKTGKKEPKRVAPGVVRAIPADAACEAALAKYVQAAAKSRRVAPSVILAEIAAGIARSQALQADADKAKEAA